MSEKYIDISIVEDNFIISYGDEKVVFKTDDANADTYIKLINLAKDKFRNSYIDSQIELFLNDFDKADDRTKRYLYRSVMHNKIKETLPYILKENA